MTVRSVYFSLPHERFYLFVHVRLLTFLSATYFVLTLRSLSYCHCNAFVPMSARLSVRRPTIVSSIIPYHPFNAPYMCVAHPAKPAKPSFGIYFNSLPFAVSGAELCSHWLFEIGACEQVGVSKRILIFISAQKKQPKASANSTL